MKYLLLPESKCESKYGNERRGSWPRWTRALTQRSPRSAVHPGTPTPALLPPRVPELGEVEKELLTPKTAPQEGSAGTLWQHPAARGSESCVSGKTSPVGREQDGNNSSPAAPVPSPQTPDPSGFGLCCRLPREHTPGSAGDGPTGHVAPV